MASQPDTTASHALRDVQAQADSRQVHIDKVGVRNVTYPIRLRMPCGNEQHTVATVNMFVSLPHHQKGTHMSRFLEVLNEHAQEIDPTDVMAICHDIRQRLNAADAVIVADVYPAGEAPIAGVDRDAVVDGLRSRGHRRVAALDDPNDLARAVADLGEPGDLAVCLGAGTVSQWAQTLPEALAALPGARRRDAAGRGS